MLQRERASKQTPFSQSLSARKQAQSRSVWFCFMHIYIRRRPADFVIRPTLWAGKYFDFIFQSVLLRSRIAIKSSRSLHKKFCPKFSIATLSLLRNLQSCYLNIRGYGIYAPTKILSKTSYSFVIHFQWRAADPTAWKLESRNLLCRCQLNLRHTSILLSGWKSHQIRL